MTQRTVGLSAKLEALGADGRGRLARAWADVEVSTKTIETRFGLHNTDIQDLKELIGRRPEPARLRPGEPIGIGRRE